MFIFKLHKLQVIDSKLVAENELEMSKAAPYVLLQLYNQLQQGTGGNVVLAGRDGIVMSSSVVLAAASDYFRSIFVSKKMETFLLLNIKSIFKHSWNLLTKMFIWNSTTLISLSIQCKLFLNWWGSFMAWNQLPGIQRPRSLKQSSSSESTTTSSCWMKWRCQIKAQPFTEVVLFLIYAFFMKLLFQLYSH